MGKHISKIGLQFREKFGYTGKIAKEAMGKDLWNEYCKMKSKERFASPEHKKDIAERKEKREQEKLKKQSDPLWKKKRLVAKYLKYTNDIYNVENFETALSENFKDWEVHHRKEENGMKMSELIAADLYYNRPAEELIFLRRSEHRRLSTVKDAELAYKNALEKIERAKRVIKSAEETIEYCKKFLGKM